MSAFVALCRKDVAQFLGNRRSVLMSLVAPVLIVRGDLLKGLKTVIADGYHRTCASYHLSENESIPCAIIDHP